MTVRRAARFLLAGALDLVYPPHCFGCERAATSASPLLCPDCERTFTRGFVRSGIPVAGGDRAEQDLPVFALGWMEQELQNVVHALKYRRMTRLASILGRHLATGMRAVAGDGGGAVLVPVPLDPPRERERGFNQAELIARAVAREWGIAAAPRWIRKSRTTGSQTALGAAKRRTNIRHSMEAAPGVSFRSRGVYLVDDVATTGATLSEAGRVIREQGGELLGAIIAARTPDLRLRRPHPGGHGVDGVP